MNQTHLAVPKDSALREGRRRLRLFLGGLGAAACAAAMVVVLVFYGLPFNPMWWAVMATTVLAAAVASGLCAPLVEWVAEGYLGGGEEN